MTAQNLTDYLSIDKLWLKYYTEEAINVPLLEDSKNGWTFLYIYDIFILSKYKSSI